MGWITKLKREVRFLSALNRTLGRVKSIESSSTNLLCDDLEAAVDKWTSRQAMSFEGRTLTYGELDAMANRFAHWAQEHKIRRGETVAIFLPNRLEYLPIWFGLQKVGVASALINNQLIGPALAHCIAISGAAHIIVDEETSEAFTSAKPLLTTTLNVWTLGVAQGGQRDLSQALKAVSALRPDRSARGDLTARDTALYIYTSGTTGLPKAARITHTRAQLYMRGFAGATGAVESDRIYVTLPLYHATGGLCGTGAALLNGGAVILRRKFSASAFWEDVAAERCTMFVYIGELCRYLANSPRDEAERSHVLRLAFGNGLRPDVWETLVTRFAVPNVLEFYGSTEGNVSMFNFDGKLGAIGRAPAYLRKSFNIRLVKFDVDAEAVVRGPDGFCVECAPGEVGECLGEIKGDARSSYTGYADKAASEKKILHDVFKAGDSYFATGDLMRQDGDGYFYFVDRIGDTFRWKGENVSTGEVAAGLLSAQGVLEANVYGVAVEGQEGRAGMAALVVSPDFDIKTLSDHVAAVLPAYAQPMFIRIQPELAATGTFKQRKVELVADGFDPARIRSALYFKSDKGYIKLTKAVHAKILAGGYRF